MADRPKGFGMTAELNEKVNKMIRPSDLLSLCWVLAMIIIFSCIIGPCIGPWVVTRETERRGEKMANRPKGYGLTAEIEAKVLLVAITSLSFLFTYRKQQNLTRPELKRPLTG